VLLEQRQDAAAPRPVDEVAPRLRELGVMLPYTPLHHLLLEAVGVPLVMTSGNRRDEPIAIDDGDALARLHGIADVFLGHDRPIQVRCDDSIARVMGGAPSPLEARAGLCAARDLVATGLGSADPGRRRGAQERLRAGP
jgi:hydrogenase maturation protein HypF